MIRKMRIVVTKEEEKILEGMQHIGYFHEMKVYDNNHKGLMHAKLELLCDCGKRHCIHTKMLLLKMLREFKVE